MSTEKMKSFLSMISPLVSFRYESTHGGLSPFMNSQYPLVGKSCAVLSGATFAIGVLYAWEAAFHPSTWAQFFRGGSVTVAKVAAADLGSTPENPMAFHPP
jgi:hypothetical protein